MDLITHHRFAAVSIAFLLSGCATVHHLPSPNSDTTLYYDAISDAAVIEPDEIASLPTIDQKTVSVVTWTKYPDSYPEGQSTELKWGDVWVTLNNDVKEKCQNFTTETLSSDLQKLLGLPLSSDQRHFVTLEVDTQALFRPCANPSLLDEKCSPEFPKDVSPAHASWYANQTAASYNTEAGFPWTRLGYTYNWKAGESEVGVAEFVIRKGAKVTTLSVSDTQAYCREQ